MLLGVSIGGAVCGFVDPQNSIVHPPGRNIRGQGKPEISQLSSADSRLNMNTSLPTTDVEMTQGREAPVNHGRDAHLVQLYSDDGLLLDVLCRFIGGAIAVG